MERSIATADDGILGIAAKLQFIPVAGDLLFHGKLLGEE